MNLVRIGVFYINLDRVNYIRDEEGAMTLYFSLQIEGEEAHELRTYLNYSDLCEVLTSPQPAIDPGDDIPF